jgi:dTDP-4-dehydrorhamnose reductase
MEKLPMKKIVVLGGTGMAGHVVATFLAEENFDVYSASKSAKDTSRSKTVDIADFSTFAALGNWLDEICPEVVVNCIGILQRISNERPDIAILVNSYLPHWIERRYNNSTVRLIHLSTDCVFSGTRGGYKEDDLRDGNTFYDRSKALGEVINGKDLTFRMSIIGPDRHENGTGLFNWFMKQQGLICGYTKALWNGVTTIELARAIKAAIEQNLSGLYHLVPQETIDKYHLLLLIKGVFNRDDITVEPFNDLVVDKTLVNTRTDFDFRVLPYNQQIEDMRIWINKHKNYYCY